MLNRTLTEHASGCFYGSEQLAVRLWGTLLQPQLRIDQGRLQFLQDDCYQQLVNVVDTRYPRRYRLNDIRRLMDRLCDARLFLSPDLPWLDVLFHQLMLRNGDLVCYRDTEVQAYVRLAAELDPTLLVAWHLSGWLQESPQPMQGDICRVVSAQTPFFAPPPNPVLSFAEGHVHLGGITSESVVLSGYLLKEDSQDKLNSNSTDQLKQLLRLRKLLKLLLAYASERDVGRDMYNPKALADGDDIVKVLSDLMDDHNALPDWHLLAASHASAPVASANWVCGQFAQAMSRGCTSSWLWLLLYICCLYRQSETSPQYRIAILCWIQTLNDVRRRMIMDGQGLTRFVERYFQNPLRRGGSSVLQDNVRRLLVGNRDVAEIKALPSAFSPAGVAKLSEMIVKQTQSFSFRPPYIFGEHEIDTVKIEKQDLLAMERWQFCGHFSRSVKKVRRDDPRADMPELWKTAEELLTNLTRHAGWSRPEFFGGHMNPHFRFQPARWFRGLDVAGDENDLRIEWFAPILRWLRRGFIARPDGEQASSGFHFSIHAGEDYAHPLSGMRHIDETVRFCGMRAGDRLGHALALGITPAQWVSRQGEMIVPLDEHLDNLVWLWHYSTVLSGRLPLAQQVQAVIERRIARLFPLTRWYEPPEIDMCQKERCFDYRSMPKPKMVSPSELFDAWLLRRNCHFHWKKLHGDLPRSAREKCALPDAAVLSNQEDVAASLYHNRHQHLVAGSKLPLVVVRSGCEWDCQALLGLPVERKEIIDDIDSAPELDFMLALQDYLLDKYDQMGLIIETNPTSNVYIARLEKHSEHPIFRWNPPDESVLAVGASYNRYGLRRGPVKVLVNTDDPGIMPTTLRTEFSLLREAATDLGIARTVAEEWLERLRRYGIEQFYQNHLTVFDTK
ncbi:adenosine deaminase [Aquitalea magnusonii]|uniref:Adenosine deaminase n=1 Tax=Aquitalea magnusonii TaxID=332411 RepID=A0A3G9G9D8_9NEIS|nr:antiviral RADAR system adenosine deaminase RdrB [Aquitalea magnusonii]BBF84084.1 adenosine deaminase [Aquitalea magnusonii]